MANEALQYMQAFQSGYQAPIDMANYPAQQAANTEILRQQALQSAQQVQLNDHTIKANMSKLLAEEKTRKQQEQIAAIEAEEFARNQTGAGQLQEAQTAAQTAEGFYSTLQNAAGKIAAIPGGSAYAADLMKKSAEYRDKATTTAKHASELQKNQLALTNSILSSVKDQESLAAAAARFKAMGMYPPDMPTTWDGRAEKWVATMKAGATSDEEKLKLKADLDKSASQLDLDQSLIAHRKKQDQLEQQRVNLLREKFEAEKAEAVAEQAAVGAIDPKFALKLVSEYSKNIQSTAKQLKLPEMLALVDQVNETFITPDGKLKPVGQRAGVDTSTLMSAYYRAHKPGALGSNLTLQQMNADLSGIDTRIWDKLRSFGIGRTVDDATLKSVINSIRSKAKSLNEEVSRIEEGQIKKAVKMGMTRKFAETQLRGTAYREDEATEAPATGGAYSTVSPAIQELVKEQMGVTGLKDPELVYDLLKQRKMIP